MQVQPEKIFTVKVQIPLNTTEAVPEALIYNEERSFVTTLPVNPDIQRQMKGRYKAFFRAVVKGQDFVLTENEVRDPGW